MPRSFDVSVDSPASVEQVHSAFSDEDYWLARLATLNGSTTLESLIVDDDQTVRVATTQDLGRDLLPGIVAKFYRRDLKVRHTETWRPIDGQLRGEISVAVSGAPGSGSGAALVAPDAERLAADVRLELWNSKSHWSAARSRASSRANSPEESRIFSTSLAKWVTEHA